MLLSVIVATSLFKMLLNYRPEDKAEKKERLLTRAQQETQGITVENKKPIVVKYGLNHVTYLIEQVLFSAIYICCSWLLRFHFLVTFLLLAE